VGSGSRWVCVRRVRVGTGQDGSGQYGFGSKRVQDNQLTNLVVWKSKKTDLFKKKKNRFIQKNFIFRTNTSCKNRFIQKKEKKKKK
jgi:hypothetical protein